MTMLTSKWFIVLALVAAVLIVVFVASKTEMHAEIVIDAPPEKVWAVLVDTEKYPEWNPVFVKVDGELGPDAKVTNHVVQPGKEPVEMGSTVRAWNPGNELNQGGGVPGLLTFDHRYTLRPEGDDTRVIQHEVDQGFYMYLWDSSWVEPAYARVNEALKARVEDLIAKGEL